MKKVIILIFTSLFIILLFKNCNKRKSVQIQEQEQNIEVSNKYSNHSNLSKIIKIKTNENEKNSINLGLFVSGEDYKYFKQNYPNIGLKKNDAEIFAFPDYPNIFAVGIPFKNMDGELVIYKNINNSKEFSFMKIINKNLNDTVIKIEPLRNPSDALIITFKNGQASLNQVPCPGDPNKPCPQKCVTWKNCVACVIDEMNNDPVFQIACMFNSAPCAILISAVCALVYL